MRLWVGSGVIREEGIWVVVWSRGVGRRRREEGMWENANEGYAEWVYDGKSEEKLWKLSEGWVGVSGVWGDGKGVQEGNGGVCARVWSEGWMQYPLVKALVAKF
jgi:hypothetical protein